jgi:vitamin K-dependent gamma-carboxylase-like protein
MFINRTEVAPNFQALSAFRILFAGYLFVEFVRLLPYYADFYAHGGIMPLDAIATDGGIAGIAIMLPVVRFADASGIMAIVPIVLPLSLVALAIGYRTRWACGIAFVLESYLFWRNPYTASGAEILARLLLLWCLFLPINRYWSVDAALDPLPRRRDWPALPFVAIRLQIASLYFFSALFKLEGAPWLKGYALLWALQDTVFAATPAGLFFVEQAPAVLKMVNYVVIAFQLSFPYMIYSPWRNELTRTIAISCSAVMHLSFIIFLNIGGFPYLCLIMLVLLMPDAWFDRALARRRGSLGAMTIYFETGCIFCEKVALLFREFLLVPRVRVLPASVDGIARRIVMENGSWVVIDPLGKIYLKWNAVAYVLRQCPIAAPLGWLTDLPGLRLPMARFYDYIGAHRSALGTVTRIFLPFRSDQPLGRAAVTLNGTLAAIALVCNFVSLDQWQAEPVQQEIHSANSTGARNGLEQFFAAVQVRQRWMLFAPIPTHWKWTFSFKAIDALGIKTDIGKAMPFVAVSDGGPIRLSSSYWSSYFRRFQYLSESEWTALGAFMCRELASAEKPADAVEVMIERAPIANSPVVPVDSWTSVDRRLPCE